MKPIRKLQFGNFRLKSKLFLRFRHTRFILDQHSSVSTLAISDSDETKKDSRACRAKQKSLRSGPAWSKTYRWLFTARLCALRRSPELPHYEPFGMWVTRSHLFVSGQFGFSWKFREHLRNFQYISTYAKKHVKSRDMFVRSKIDDRCDANRNGNQTKFVKLSKDFCDLRKIFWVKQ